MATVKKLLRDKTVSVLLILIGACILLGIINPAFFKFDNLYNVSRVASYTAIFAFGELLVILIGGIDLTIGSVIGIVGVVVCVLEARTACPTWLAIIISLLVGAAVGGINAFFINVVTLPPYITTMSMAQILKSIAFLLSDARPVMGVSEGFMVIGKGDFLGLPIAVWIMAVIAIILSIFLNKTVTGRRIYALGGNREAAKFSGINTTKISSGIYIASGLLAAISGIILASKLGSAQGNQGSGYESDAIASTIIGGTSFSGGEGRVSGTLVGACIMAVIRNALVLLNVSTYTQSMIIGLLIIAAVSIDTLRGRAAQKVSKQFIMDAIENNEKNEKN